MKRSAWKWLFGISLAFLILMIVFEVGIWAVGNATAALLGGMMGSLDPDNFGYRHLPLDEFIIPKVGSPLFYIYMADLVVLVSSIVMLIVTRKQKTNTPQGEIKRGVEVAAPYKED